MPAGRPKKYTSEKQVADLIEAYFAECKDEEEPLTISGLAYALDMSTETLRMYGKDDEFSATIKKAKQKVERAWEKHLLKGGSGSIFWLKNNAGWKDKTEVDSKHTVNVSRKDYKSK